MGKLYRIGQGMGDPAADTTVQIFHFDTPNQKGTLPNLKDNLSGLGHACASFLFFLDSHVLIQAICKDQVSNEINARSTFSQYYR